MSTQTIPTEPTAKVERVPFGVEHIKAVCADIKYPSKVAKRDLRWGFRLNRPDLVSTNDFRWPFPGNWAVAPGPIRPHRGGICAAHTISGATSNGARIGTLTGLLVAWLDDDVLGSSDAKVRLRRAWVAELFDPVRAITSADLRSADLRSADLRSADLRSANLRYANLTYANLRYANLTYANLTYASLTYANLRSANLTYANLTYANLTYATYTQLTLFPAGFDVKASGAVLVP